MITMDDQYRFEDFGLICEVGHKHPLTPNMERKTLAIPGKVGLWDFGTEIREKPLAIPLGIIDMNRMYLQRKLNDFVAFLFDPYGQPREIKIVYDYDPDKYYLVKCTVLISPEDMISARKFILPFIADFPRKQAIAENHEIHWDSETVTFDDSYSMDTVYVDDVLVTSPQIVETTVNGYALSPTILISGSGQNVILKANGKSMSLGNFANSTFEIRGYDFTITKDGSEVFIVGEFLTLLPGMNSVEILGTNINFNLSIRIRDQYM